MPELPLFPVQASSMAGEVDAIFFAALAISIFFSLLIAVAITVLAITYRRRRPDAQGVSYEAPAVLELTWSVVPLLITLVLFAWGADVYFRARRPPADAREYTAVGKQWMWKFQHPQGRREINELHLPVGLPIKLTMTSEDVIHSLFVPAFRAKMDVIPGRYTTLWFRPTRAGTYHLFCTEYCGAEHSLMRGRVVVLEPHEYERFLAGPGGDKPPAERGAELFTKLACNTCHLGQPGARGPDLRGFWGTPRELVSGRTAVADEGYVRESILDPGAKVAKGFTPVMPTFKGQVGEEDILALIAYLKTLAAAAAPPVVAARTPAPAPDAASTAPPTAPPSPSTP